MASVGRVLLMSGAQTASTNGEAKILELYSAAFVGFSKATGVHADTTLDTKIQHSANGSDWVDLCTFNQLVGVNGYDVEQITVNVLPYVRAVSTLAGTTQQATVEIALYFDKLK